MKKVLPFVFLISILILPSLACEINIGGPKLLGSEIPISDEAVQSLNAAWENAFQVAKETGQLNLIIDESQITSYLAKQLKAGDTAFIQDPQVYLRDGQIAIYGKMHQGYLTANARIVLDVGIDDSGLPQFDLASAEFGPLPVPENLLIGLSSTLDAALTGDIGSKATGVRIDTIAIESGLMAINGQIR